jgi:hypothetical protein
MKGGTRNPRKSVLTSKIVNPFTRALEPLFIGRRSDFYIHRLPSNLGNISSVNMYMNDFYIPWFVGLISYIYKFATSSHFEPGLLRQRLWLGLPLTAESSFAKVASFWSLQINLPNPRSKRGSPSSLKFPISQYLKFAIFMPSWYREQICDTTLILQLLRMT